MCKNKIKDREGREGQKDCERGGREEEYGKKQSEGERYRKRESQGERERGK